MFVEHQKEEQLRPAGLLVKKVKKYASKVTISKDGKSAEAAKLMAVMGLGVKKGDTIDITVEGADEDRACEAVQTFFENNL